MTKRDRIVLGVVAVVAVMAAFYVGVVKPRNAEVADLDERTLAAEQRRDVALSDLRTATAAREQYMRDQTTLAVLGKAVPEEDGVPSLLYQLHKAARRAGVDFDSVTVGGPGSAGSSSGATPGAVEGPDGLTQLPLNITFDGTFFELDKFLRSVHRFATIGDEKVDIRGRLLTIDNVALTPAEGGLPTVTAEITANAYMASDEDSPSTTGEAPTPAASTDSSTSAADAGATQDASSTPSPSTGATE